MKNQVNIQIAKVHLTSRIWQTVVAILGVIFGVSMYIFMNSFMNGVNEAQDNLAFSALSHIRIYNSDGTNPFNPAEQFFPNQENIFNITNKKNIKYTEGIKNSQAIVSLLEKHKEVKSISCQLNSSVFFRSGKKEINGVLCGVEAINDDKLFGHSEKVTEGEWMDLVYRKSGVILGKVLAENLGVHVNDNINVLTPEGISKSYTVIGIIETSVKEIDKSKAFINISAARQLFSKNSNYASDIVLNIKNRDKTEALIRKISPLVPFQIESWQSANQQLVAASQLRNIIAIAVSLTILLVAGFGIYNIMNMTVNEKIKEIAILKAMGFSGGDVKTIFLLQAAVIGITGGITGIALGYGISALVNQVPFRIAGLSTLPISYNSHDFILALFFGITTTLFAGYLPSKKASKIDPVIIIRG